MNSVDAYGSRSVFFWHWLFSVIRHNWWKFGASGLLGLFAVFTGWFALDQWPTSPAQEAISATELIGRAASSGEIAGKHRNGSWTVYILGSEKSGPFQVDDQTWERLKSEENKAQFSIVYVTDDFNLTEGNLFLNGVGILLCLGSLYLLALQLAFGFSEGLKVGELGPKTAAADGGEPEAQHAFFAELCEQHSGEFNHGTLLSFAQYRPITLAGYPHILEYLEKIVSVARALGQHERTVEVSLPKTPLFFGPSGTGKTSWVRQFAFEHSIPMIEITPSDIFGKYHSETERAFAKTFTAAKRLSQSLRKEGHLGLVILLLDEIETFLPSESETRVMDALRSEVFSSIGEGSKADPLVLLVGTTNYRDKVDPAFRRRTEELYLPKPDMAARAAILQSMLEGESELLELLEPYVLEIAGEKSDWVASDLRDFVDNILRRSIAQQDNSGFVPWLSAAIGELRDYGLNEIASRLSKDRLEVLITALTDSETSPPDQE